MFSYVRGIPVTITVRWLVEQFGLVFPADEPIEVPEDIIFHEFLKVSTLHRATKILVGGVRAKYLACVRSVYVNFQLGTDNTQLDFGDLRLMHNLRTQTLVDVHRMILHTIVSASHSTRAFPFPG